jgi:tRNA threonylcarbamoyladenosine biosynthesis protein TsaE
MAEITEPTPTLVTFVVETASPRETKSWGRRLASVLEGGELVGLIGDLGAGKTIFIKGLARGLGLPEEEILSPTFTMIQEHRGRLPLYHIDLYRLESATIDDLGLREYLFGEAISTVEWFDRLAEMSALENISVRISFVGANRRRLEFSATAPRYAALLSTLKLRFA